MKNKFFKALAVINGILIPIFILYVLGNALNSHFSTKKIASSKEPEQPEKITLETKHSSLIKIPNSDNFAIAEYYLEKSSYLGNNVEDLNLPYDIPKNTFNIIFLDSKLNEMKKLLNQKASIQGIFISNIFSSHHDKVKEELTHLSFYIALEDTNSDGKIDFRDQHYVYVSDLNGENLTKVSHRIVHQFEWINHKELLLTFENDKDSDIKYGIYNVNNESIRETKTIR